jgi:hypothetical protein
MRFCFLCLAIFALGFAEPVDKEIIFSADEEEAPPPLDQQLKPSDLPSIEGVKSNTCHVAEVDLMFVIDQSGSIGQSNFDTVKQFLNNIVNELVLPGARVGLVKFNSKATGYFQLNKYSTKSGVQAAISHMVWGKGTTNIAAGMNYATNYEFVSKNGDRADVDDVMVVLTDGHDSSDVATAQLAAADKGIKVIAIGLGNAYWPELMKVVGGDHNLVHMMKNFTQLSGIVDIICNQSTSACDGNPCNNGGTCTETNGGNSYVCTCPRPYTGERCESTINPCDPNPCKNTGTCIISGGSYICHCPSDFTDKNCSTWLNPCASEPCHNGASCEPTGGKGYQCFCPIGYYGDNCQNAICKNGGIFSCKCPYGYTGLRCEKLIDFCNGTEIIVDGKYVTVDICGPHGTCTNTNYGPVCSCKTGWHGQYCRIDDNDCSPNPCKNGGTCYNLPGPNYICACDKLHTGKDCESDVDLCNREAINTTGQHVTVKLCGHNGVCSQSSKGASCECYEGWTGQFCDIEIPYNCPYKNSTHLHNSTWTDHCDVCNCQFGVTQCSVAEWCPQQCAIYPTNATIAKGVKVGCPDYQNCVPEDVNCAHEKPPCSNPIGWCFPTGYVIVDPQLPPNFRPPKYSAR